MDMKLLLASLVPHSLAHRSSFSLTARESLHLVTSVLSMLFCDTKVVLLCHPANKPEIL